MLKAKTHLSEAERDQLIQLKKNLKSARKSSKRYQKHSKYYLIQKKKSQYDNGDDPSQQTYDGHSSWEQQESEKRHQENKNPIIPMSLVILLISTTIISKTSLGKSKVGAVVAATLGGLLSMPVVNNLEHIVESMSDNSEARQKSALIADNLKKYASQLVQKILYYQELLQDYVHRFLTSSLILI